MKLINVDYFLFKLRIILEHTLVAFDIKSSSIYENGGAELMLHTYLVCTRACLGLSRRREGILLAGDLDELPGEIVCGWTGHGNRDLSESELAETVTTMREDGLNLPGLQILHGKGRVSVRDWSRWITKASIICIIGSYYYWEPNLLHSLLFTYDFIVLSSSCNCYSRKHLPRLIKLQITLLIIIRTPWKTYQLFNKKH